MLAWACVVSLIGLAGCSSSHNVGTGGGSPGGAIIPSEQASTIPPPTPSSEPSTPVVPPSASPGATGVAAALPTGNYADGAAGTPHYVLRVDSTSPTEFTGWVYFLYQDGRTAAIFHYSATGQAAGAFSLKTDTSTQSFPVGTPSSQATGGQAGSSPIPAGLTYSGTYQADTVVLSNCGVYLYWATVHSGSGPAMSCTFTYSGPS
jgi:hypothetical protein